MAICWSCGGNYELPDGLMRASECPHCTAYLRCCRNCDFYDENAHNQCRETQAGLQGDKEAANSCDYFRAAREVKPVSSGKPRADFGSLFKDD